MEKEKSSNGHFESSDIVIPENQSKSKIVTNYPQSSIDESVSHDQEMKAYLRRMGVKSEDDTPKFKISDWDDYKHKVSDKKRSILEEAIEVTENRQKRYGDPKEVFEAIASLWNSYIFGMIINKKPGLLDELVKLLGKDITSLLSSRDVSQMMALLKIGRSLASEDHRDNYVDMAGYARISASLSGEREELNGEKED